MSALTMTFTELLADLENRVGLNSESGNGDVTSTNLSRAALTRFLGNAAKTCWEMPEGRNWVWPFTVQTATLTPGTGGKIALSDIDWGVWLSLWSTDPRPAGSGGRTAAAFPIPWTADSDGVWPNVAPASVFAFYIKRAPEYSTTAVATSTAYAADAIVYDPATRSGGTGNCFRCVAAYTSSSSNSTLTTELADSTKWVLQPVYRHFQSAMAQYAHATWLRRLGAYDEARAMEAEARDDLEHKFCGIYPNSPTATAPAWYQTGAWR